MDATCHIIVVRYAIRLKKVLKLLPIVCVRPFPIWTNFYVIGSLPELKFVVLVPHIVNVIILAIIVFIINILYLGSGGWKRWRYYTATHNSYQIIKSSFCDISSWLRMIQAFVLSDHFYTQLTIKESVFAFRALSLFPLAIIMLMIILFFCFHFKSCN